MNQIKIGNFIAECRRKKNLTQGELGEKLEVSYKAVSKWENGICLPDSSLYEEICNIFKITKDEFFAGEYKEKNYANKKEFIILIFSLIIIFLSFLVPNNNIKTIILCLIFIVVIFFLTKNINMLTKISKNSLKINKIKIFNYILMVIMPVLMIVDFYNESILNNYTLSLIAASVIIVFGGIFLSDMPYNKYIGFRLPWIIRDESTWVLAHKILFYISVPIAIAILICGYFLKTETAISIGILLWITIPGLISLYHYYKKIIK